MSGLSTVNNLRDVKAKNKDGTTSLRVGLTEIEGDTLPTIPVLVTNNDPYCCAIAGETISAIKAIVQSVGNVLLAEPDTYSNATVLGISITSATASSEIKYKKAGELYDTSLNFPLNDPLYLGAEGLITNVAPVSGFRTRVGHSLGVGGMMIQIEEPIEL